MFNSIFLSSSYNNLLKSGDCYFHFTETLNNWEIERPAQSYWSSSLGCRCLVFMTLPTHRLIILDIAITYIKLFILQMRKLRYYVISTQSHSQIKDKTPVLQTWFTWNLVHTSYKLEARGILTQTNCAQMHPGPLF